jgi:hypothetical protein
VLVSEHQPLMVTWVCNACAADWPCHTRRLQLLAQYEGKRDELSAYLVGEYVKAREDLAGPVLELHRRFIGWLDDRVPGRQ